MSINYTGDTATCPARVMDDLLLRVNVYQAQVSAVTQLLDEAGDEQGFVSVDRIREAIEGAAPELLSV